MRKWLPILVGATMLALASAAPSLRALFAQGGSMFDSQSAAQPAKKSDDDVRKAIQDQLAHEPQLKGLAITVRVEPRRIVLGGEVHTIDQKNVAIQIARSNADGREVIDDFRIIPSAH
jgi:osmotically-inducible protein OsmY